jgi:hypothetical protein
MLGDGPFILHESPAENVGESIVESQPDPSLSVNLYGEIHGVPFVVGPSIIVDEAGVCQHPLGYSLAG